MGIPLYCAGADAISILNYTERALILAHLNYADNSVVILHDYHAFIFDNLNIAP